MKTDSHHELLNKAMKAAERAYAPYSQLAVGVSILSDRGGLFSGCNVENASYPLGQCAEGNAIAAMILEGHREIKEVLIFSRTTNPLPPCGGCLQRISEFALPEIQIYLYNNDSNYKRVALSELLPHPFNSNYLEKP